MRSASIRRSRSTTRRSQVENGDIFVLATDGVYEHVGARFVAAADPRSCRTIWTRRRRLIVDEALQQRQPGQSHGPDRPARSSCPTARPARCSGRHIRTAAARRCSKRAQVFDGYRIVREMHASSRSHIYLAVDIESDDAGRDQDPLDRPARRPGLSEALHDGGVGRAPHRQPARAEALRRRRESATFSTSSPNSSTARH